MNISDLDWQPTASAQSLKQRAEIYRRIRLYFEENNVLEVETPALSEFNSTDVHIEQWRTENGYALHTSPEFAMKRLLAAGVGDIYQICKVFRIDESSRRHNPEFSMLEWYRVGWDEFKLMKEVVSLIEYVSQKAAPPVHYVSFASLFAEHHLPSPHVADVVALRLAAEEHLNADTRSWSASDCIDALMSGVVEPNFDPESLTFVYYYPKEQAALAELISVEGQVVGRRFELYWGVLELANGYFELTNADEQQVRMLDESSARIAEGLPSPSIDLRFVNALRAGMPVCAGVALGLDRLVMAITDANHIDDVISFPIHRA